MATVKVNMTSGFGRSERHVVEVELPEGYYRVWRGGLKPGDLFLNGILARDGITEWLPVPLNDPHYKTAELFGCLIRVGTEVDKTCERCEAAARSGRNRFCLACCAAIRRANQEDFSSRST